MRALWLSDTNEVSNVESVKLIKSYTKQQRKKEEIVLWRRMGGAEGNEHVCLFKFKNNTQTTSQVFLLS